MRLLHEIAIFQTVKSKIIISLFETVKLSVSISLRNPYNLLNSIKEKCLHPTSSKRELCTLSVSNVIYHKFSHGAAFYTLNGKNVNVMLELGNNFPYP